MLARAISDLIPPSSLEALGFLAEFSSPYDLESQFSAALAMALIFPTDHFYRTIARLPFPTRSRGYKITTPLKRAEPELGTINKGLQYYMALSSNASVVMSTLCGVFWDVDIACNLVSPWLHPILREIPNGEGVISAPGRYHEILAFVCAKFCPPLSALWLGAAISELISKVLKLVGSGTPTPTNLNTFP